MRSLYAWSWLVGCLLVPPAFVALHAQPAPAIAVEASPLRPADAARADAAGREAAARYSVWLGPASAPGRVLIRPPWWPAPESMDVESQTAYAVALEWLRPLHADAETATLARGLAWYLQSRIVETLYDLAFLQPGHSVDGTRWFGGVVPRTFHELPLGRWTAGLARADRRWTPAAVRPADLDPGSVRMALTFGTLERYLGWPSLQGALHALAARAAAGPMTRLDAVNTLGDAAGQDLRWLFDAAFDSSQVFDYAVESVGVQAASRPCGFEPCFESRVVVVRRGTAVFSGPAAAASGPYEAGDAMELRVEFADGSVASTRWDGRAASRTFEYLSATPASTARLDPDRVLLLDRNYLDNTRVVSPRPATATAKWVARWTAWLQDAMLAYTF